MPSSIPRAVIDTNTLLDWLVFRDPIVLPLACEIEAGRLTWHASPAMRREFERVLPRAVFLRWLPDARWAAAAWHRHAVVEAIEPPATALRCSDPDDQVFIDLALQRRCTWLITRDRALLKLARRALPFGVRVLTPIAWHDAHAMQAHTHKKLQD